MSIIELKPRKNAEVCFSTLLMTTSLIFCFVNLIYWSRFPSVTGISDPPGISSTVSPTLVTLMILSGLSSLSFSDY